MTATFYFRDKSADASLLMLALRDRDKRLSLSTGIVERVSYFNRESQTFTMAMTSNIKLNRWKEAVARAQATLTLEGGDIYRFKDLICTIMEKTTKATNNGGEVLPYFQKWANESTATHKATRGTAHSARLFAEFLQSRNRTTIAFNEFTVSLGEEYVNWLAKRGLAPNTRGGHIKNLRTIFAKALTEGLHNNRCYEHFKREREETTEIYLTKDEIRRIEELELSGYLERTRDLFLLGCYTAMRWSDYSRLVPEDIQDGFIRQIQTKTKEEVVIPVHPKVKMIIEKYGGSPRISQQKFNDNIKDICRDAGIDEMISVRHGDKIEKRAKYRLVSSHTARRSAATNMFLAGIPPISIMKITGHRSESIFMQYIRITKEQNAKSLANNPFFTL